MRISINRDGVIALYSDSEGLYGYLYLKDGRLMLLNRTALDYYGTYTASFPICQVLYDNGLFPQPFLKIS
jgi:hypothetical protein